MRAPRLGSVPYLNARPLVRGLEATLDIPSRLSQRFLAGEFDAALLPVYETLRLSHPIIADGFGIGAIGAVQSVIVAHRLPLEETQEILLDPSSRTSVHLLQVLLSNYLKIPAKVVETSENPHVARLIIGDPALHFRQTMGPEWEIFDLGRAWHEWTSLPFVFAVWTLSREAPEGTAELLRGAARRGLEARPSIAAKEANPLAALDYLTHSIHYPIGEAEKAGIERFRTLLAFHEFLPSEAGLPEYV